MKSRSLPAIKHWAEDDRPREKLLAKGKDTLSDAELIAILIGSGSREENAVDLCKRILASSHHNLNELAKYSVLDLCEFKGIGEAKAVSSITALELGRRRQSEDIIKKPVINSSEDAFRLMRPLLGDLQHEEFWALYINNSNKVLHKEQLSKGGINETILDIRLVYKKALENAAIAVILCHNHPTRNLNPSQSDISLTENVKNAGNLLNIRVLDHLIITQQGYYSFADAGKL